MKITLIISSIILIIFGVCYSLYRRYKDKKWYNNGICLRCNGKIESTASYATGQEFTCSICGNKNVLEYYNG